MNYSPQVDEEVQRQPLLNDAVIALSAPTQVWSRTTGDLGEGSIDGLYHGDTRFFRVMSMRCGGREPEWISLAPDGASQVTFGGLLRDLDDTQADPRVRLMRDRVVSDGRLDETLTIRAHLAEAISTRVTVRFEPEFAPLTDVKAGGVNRARFDIESVPVDGTSVVIVRSENRSATVTASGAMISVDSDGFTLTWDVNVTTASSTSVSFRVELADPGLVVQGARRPAEWAVDARSGDSRVAGWLSAALDDLAALRLALPEHPEDEFFAAGAPWFFTLFGRDSIWAARLMLPIDARMAASTLRVLARLQGAVADSETAQQRGKILHELRSAPLAMPDGLLLPPLYFGTVDATALWVCLLADAWDAGMAEAEVRALLPALRGCLEWILDHGDRFLDYQDTTGHGLANQGWKDSGDSIQWRDGTLADGPIALCEVQGYAYEAAIAGARMLEAMDEPGAAELRGWAARLKERFADSYWVDTPEGRYPAVALDAYKKPVDTLTSNIGHLIGTGILDADEERHVATLLLGESMRTGYGIRTMSSESAGYWPLSYHGGSVWAHDTAIIARGLAKAGLQDEARAVAEDLLSAAEGFGFRMPELHAGDPASETRVPTPYPAACRPQAWSAAAAVTVADIVGALEKS